LVFAYYRLVQEGFQATALFRGLRLSGGWVSSHDAREYSRDNEWRGNENDEEEAHGVARSVRQA
jgi:hypothetical protein